MTSQKESSDVAEVSQVEDEKMDKPARKEQKEVTELPPSGTSLHKRRRGEPPASLSVKSPQTPSDADGSSPCTAGLTPEESWGIDGETIDPEALCESMLQRLKDRDDPLSKRGTEVASRTKDTLESLDQLEKLLELLDQFVTLKEKNNRILRRLKDVNHLKRLHTAYKRINKENEKLKDETKELEHINEALDAELECEYGQALFDSMMSGSRSMKRTGSRWKTHSRFGGSLLRKQRSRSAGGDDSDTSPGTLLRRRSDGVFSKEVEKSKVSNWTKVKAAFKWEKAHWPSATIGGAAAVAAGAMATVALVGSTPNTPGPLSHAPGALPNPEPRDSASLTPGSAISLSPNSSCEELRIEAGMCRRSGIRSDDQETGYLQAPMQDDSSTSPSPNKLHKSPWVKMRDIIQTHRESVKKKTRPPKGSPDVLPARRRSLSDGGDSDAPPALTLTIPSSEELESEGSHPVLRKQRSLELGARPPQHRQPRDSKWSRVKRAFLTSASASVPSSPNRHSAFFTDADTEGVSSGCEASAVREEIARDYAALQTRLGREISDRRGKLGYPAPRPVATEEQLSADFRKKLTEWQRMKGVRQPPPVPARKDLSEDFLKKWDEWKRMKETNSVPAWEEEAKPDEVLVRTSTGLFKFHGISRSFTRKLHEWEKSRGIAPEASTSALLNAARAKAKPSSSQLTRTQSDGSVAPSAGSGRMHASSLSVNDVDDFESEYEREHSLDGADECDGNSRAAVLVEVEAEEVCTAAPLVAVTPRHTPQKPVYTYGQAEARHLCETSSAITGTAVVQPNGAVVLSDSRSVMSKEQTTIKATSSREQVTGHERISRSKMIRQASIEEDAKFIRKTIEEIERGSSSRYKEDVRSDFQKQEILYEKPAPSSKSSSLKSLKQLDNLKDAKNNKDSNDEMKDENKRKDLDKNNGKKKSKSRARLEREQSKPSESDSNPDVDTVTVEIPRRRKRPRRPSERPRTPPTSLHSDSDGEVFVLRLKAPPQRDVSPEVIVKTTRKIFSPVVRSGESIPRAVIPVNVEDLDDVRPVPTSRKSESRQIEPQVKQDLDKSKSAGDILEEQRPRRPPLPLSPPSQRKPLLKEASPSIRIMIQRYNQKINEEGPGSGGSSGASSPAWRSPKSERRRPPDMPVSVNIRNNPFLEREVQKSASACQLSRRDKSSADSLSPKRVTPTPQTQDGVLKSHSANVLHPEQEAKSLSPKKEDNQETIKTITASTDASTLVPNRGPTQEDLSINTPKDHGRTITEGEKSPILLPVLRQQSEIVIPNLSRFMPQNPCYYERSMSAVECPALSKEAEVVNARLSERAARIRAARDKFLSSPSAVPMRREGTSSASDLRPADRSSRISCESDVTEDQGAAQEAALGRSASTGMVNVDRDAWQRIAEGRGRERPRSRFSLARLAAKLRRKEESAVSRLCRQSLFVQLRKQ